MNEEIDFILDSTKEAMNGAIAHLEKELKRIQKKLEKIKAKRKTQ